MRKKTAATEPEANPDPDLLEIYKLHVGLADKVSDRRAQANHFYLTVLTGLLAILSFSANRDNNIHSEQFLLVCFMVGLLGIIISLIWMINIRSYRQLNDGKMKNTAVAGKKTALRLLCQRMEIAGAGRRQEKNTCP
ncbi:MAG: hypothetical protein IPL65_21245 [Lewinellaceae bacterium]|nr:hypothetical protein [Lewinellaceae bacterium]